MYTYVGLFRVIKCKNINIKDKIEPTVPVKRSSPAVKVNDKPETSGEDGVDVEVVDEPGDAVDVGDAWSQFDIGSPENGKSSFVDKCTIVQRII